MTIEAVRAGDPRATPLARAALVVTMIAGCVALLSRPVSAAFVPITVAVALAGALHRVDRERRASARDWTACVVLGIGAFALARVLLGGDLVPVPTGALLALVVVAAFAEELFFRRFMFGVLARYGAAMAIAVSSIAFALVHVSLWGWRAVPVDLAAGALFGWQRWATGSWTSAAITHAAANILMLL